MNADDMLDILTLQEAVKILRRNVPNAGMMAHDGYAEHSHEVRTDHAGVGWKLGSLETDPNANAIRWLTEVIGWIKKEGEKEA